MDVFFFGSCNGGERLGNWQSVNDGDFFAICDGETVVALGKSLGRFSEYQDSGFYFTRQDDEKFIDDEVRICPAKIEILPQEQQID